MSVYCLRQGDMDDYHSFDDLDELAAHLVECDPNIGSLSKKISVTGTSARNLPETRAVRAQCPSYGVVAKGYEGWNYISLYYGEDIETPTRDLTQKELRALNVEIKRLKEECRA
jgi:hypothetical protein